MLRTNVTSRSRLSIVRYAPFFFAEKHPPAASLLLRQGVAFYITFALTGKSLTYRQPFLFPQSRLCGSPVKKSRSDYLSGCKRPHDDNLSLLTFCDSFNIQLRDSVWSSCINFSSPYYCGSENSAMLQQII